MQSRDGGPAFPQAVCSENEYGHPTFYVGRPGLSLLDWFAGQALMGILSLVISRNPTSKS